MEKLRAHLGSTVRLATPVAMSQLGLMVMILVDTYMVGKLGPSAIAGVGLGSAIFYGFTLFGSGTLFGLDALVSQAYGRKDWRSCHYWLVQACYLAVVLAGLLIAGLYLLSYQLHRFGLDPAIVEPAGSFLRTLSWSLLPFHIFIAFRQYLAAMSVVKATTLLMVLANLVNAFLNWVFVFGNLGSTAYGVAGAGLATTGTRMVMALGLVLFALHQGAGHEGITLARASKRFDWKGMKELLGLGLPSGVQMVVRSLVFSLATTLIARAGALSLAAHTIVLNIASFTYMLPVGISAAASVLVGQSLGRGEPAEARFAGWASLVVGILSTAATGALLYGFGALWVGFFTDDAEVIELGRRVLLLAACFQVADGIQAVAAGALRGMSDTRSAMLSNFVGHWLIGLPIGYYLCFHRHLGVVGFWTGLTAGLWCASALMLAQWMRKLRQFS